MTGASTMVAAFGSCWASRSYAYLAPVPRRRVHVGERLFDALRFAAAGERLQDVRAQPRSERVRRDERLAQPFGRLEGAQGGVVAAAHELEHAAAVVQPHAGGQLDFGPDGAFGPAEGPLRFLEPSLGDHRHAKGQIGDANDRLIGPAVLVSQLNRLQAALCPQREGPPAHQLRPVRKAGDLHKGPADLVREGDALREVPVRLVQARCPDLDDAEVDQRQRPQVPAQLELICSPGHCGGQQPLRLLRHGREIPALTCPAHPHPGEKRPRVAAPVRGNRLQRPG
jgi:hypothetical protein